VVLHRDARNRSATDSKGLQRKGLNVADSLSDWAEKTPFAAAIVDRDRVIHYRDLDRAVWRAAAWLRDHGVRPGDRVGLSLGRNSVDFLVAVYVLARMGAALMLVRRPRHRQSAWPWPGASISPP
jgi:acyl-CoA synthetase (AMP-forming)/AMP-acid ligase II